MNKYFILLGVLILLILGGLLFRGFNASEQIETGVVRELTIVASSLRWEFNPDYIEADQGDRLKITLVNEDAFDHGFGLDAYGISQRMPANSTIVVDFVVTRAGDFPFYCSVSCGEGVVDGTPRGHFDQVGKLHVRSAETQ